MSAPPFLTELDERIETRVRAIVGAHPWWPCRRGCDACCRSLGEIPHATRAEWDRLGEGVQDLDEGLRSEIAARIADLADAPRDLPVVCPFLDPGQGACLVYQHRLLACRAYGYCVSRGDGRWCATLETALPTHDEPIMFGNFDAIMDQARGAGGDTITLLEWWRSR
jgi:Fe-S-cluster containining protein